jgi:hypothetical protein
MPFFEIKMKKVVVSVEKWLSELSMILEAPTRGTIKRNKND